MEVVHNAMEHPVLGDGLSMIEKLSSKDHPDLIK